MPKSRIQQNRNTGLIVDRDPAMSCTLNIIYYDTSMYLYWNITNGLLLLYNSRLYYQCPFTKSLIFPYIGVCNTLHKSLKLLRKIANKSNTSHNFYGVRISPRRAKMEEGLEDYVSYQSSTSSIFLLGL